MAASSPNERTSARTNARHPERTHVIPNEHTSSRTNARQPERRTHVIPNEVRDLLNDIHEESQILLFLANKARLAAVYFKSRWHSWIAQPPPKGQVGGSNPLRDASEINKLQIII